MLLNRKEQAKVSVETCLLRCQDLRQGIATDPADAKHIAAEIETDLKSCQDDVGAIAAQLGLQYRDSLELGKKFVQELHHDQLPENSDALEVHALKSLKTCRDDLYPPLDESSDNCCLLPIDPKWEWGWFRLGAGLNALQRSAALLDGTHADAASATSKQRQRPEGVPAVDETENASSCDDLVATNSGQTEFTPRAGQRRPGYLGLQFDEDRFVVTRVGNNQEVDFSKFRLGWHLLKKLASGENRWSSGEALELVWQGVGVADNPQKSTLYKTVRPADEA
jgi:hypothetical protein